MFVYILTHENEINRKSGTGKIVKDILNDSCNIIPWRRMEPDSKIEKDLDPENTILVYLSSNPVDTFDISKIKNFIIIDGTWQEAKKIYNRSPYLKRFRHIELNLNIKSNYNLRRNQKNFGLCTIETVMELCKLKKESDLYNNLSDSFNKFIELY